MRHVRTITEVEHHLTLSQREVRYLRGLLAFFETHPLPDQTKGLLSGMERTKLFQSFDYVEKQR